MSKLTFDITMSLDGFIAGPNPRIEEPLGDGGERLHQWVYGLEAWQKNQGDEPPFKVPVFVLTHHARETLTMKGGTTFTFVTDGPQAALEQARTAAAGKDVARCSWVRARGCSSTSAPSPSIWRSSASSTPPRSPTSSTASCGSARVLRRA